MKKDPIDSLFEEKLKDYSELPDEKVWKSIEKSLDQRKNTRRVIPIWWKLGGVAAVLALLFYLISPVADIPTGEENISDTEDVKPVSPEIDSEPALRLNPAGPAENEVTSGNTGSQDDTQGNGLQPGTKEQSPNPGPSAPKDQIADRETERDDTPALSPNSRTASVEEKSSTGQPATRTSENATQEEPQLAVTNPGREVEPDREADPGNANGTREGLNGKPGEREIAETDEEDSDSEGKSIFEAIAESEEEEEALASNNGPKWSVGPKVAPVYFNSFGEGSPIHSNFVSNSKSGNINMSYGLSLSYAITPKLSIRSGINKVDYGYDTNDITFSPSLATSSGQQLTTIDYAFTSRNLVVRNSSQAKLAQDVLEAEVSAEFAFRDGRMIQQFGYVEVPLELNLALVDKKFGLNVIGGVSSLFLIDNSVLLESEGNALEMGEANNLNTLNFSTNIGFGVEYEVSPRIQLNLEPVFKYQLNTFSASAGTFNPYSIGVYSGINFRF